MSEPHGPSYCLQCSDYFWGREHGHGPLANPTWRDYLRVITRGLWWGVKLGLGVEERQERQGRPLNARVDVVTMDDGHRSIVVRTVETPEQIESRVRHEEFTYYMNLFKENNGAGSMTAAMLLMVDSDYYERGVCRDISMWRHYLKRLLKSKGED